MIHLLAYAGKCARVMILDLFLPRPMWTPTPKVAVVNYMTKIESMNVLPECMVTGLNRCTGLNHYRDI